MPTLLLAMGLLALAILLVLYWRTAQRVALFQAELDRLRVVQRDAATDVRARLEESTGVWEDGIHSVRTRLEQLEPSIADLSATLDEHMPSVGEARGRLEDLEGRLADIEAVASAAASGLDKAAEERVGGIEEAVCTLRDAADEKLADVAARITLLERAAHARPTEETALSGETEVPLEEAVVTSTDAPATYGGGRGRKKTRGRSGARWLVVVLALAGGAVLVLTTIG